MLIRRALWMMAVVQKCFVVVFIQEKISLAFPIISVFGIVICTTEFSHVILCEIVTIVKDFEISCRWSAKWQRHYSILVVYLVIQIWIKKITIWNLRAYGPILWRIFMAKKHWENVFDQSMFKMGVWIRIHKRN